MSAYDLYVGNCLKLCLQDDYGNCKKLRAHNKAMDNLAKPEAEMPPADFLRLLVHEDERVRLNAAAACVRRKLCYDEAVATPEESKCIPPTVH